MQKKIKLIDTNILLKYPLILEELDEAAIALGVLKEIDGLKKNDNPETAYEARRAAHYLSNNTKKLKFILKRNKKLSVDDELVKIAKKKNYELVTNDINVTIQCIARGVSYSTYSNNKEDVYTGVQYLILPFDENKYNKDVEDILAYGKAPFKMHENEFLIIKNENSPITLKNGDTDYETICTLQFKNDKLSMVSSKGIKNSYINYIKARNSEQECLMELLNNQDVTILLAAGTFGVGKSFLLINYALQQLEQGKINKIVYVPNNAFNENSREIGALPGDLLEKELIHMGPLVDIVGSMYVEQMVGRGEVEVVPVSVMRGRSFNNSIIIVNEAQNLTEDHIKLLIARCGGDNTRIFFDGDIKQADSHIFRNKNGLKLLSKLKDSPVFGKIFGTVRLKNIERSLTAQAAAYLDEN